MIGQLENNGACPVCGGRLHAGTATIPFVFADTVVLVKNVPAEICASCREPFTRGQVTDQITQLVKRVKDLRTEVSVISYVESERVFA